VIYDTIKEIGIDESGRLCVAPSSETFAFIYREALEVGWEPNGCFLYSPKPREWTYTQWFQQIVSAARVQGCVLKIGLTTNWRNVPTELRDEISEWANTHWA